MPRVDAARNRERVLQVGRECLDRGDATLALNEVAKIAGLGVATVYRHFPTRQALLEALMDERLEALLGELTAAADDPDVSAGLTRLVRAVLVRELSDVGFAEVFAADVDERPETTRLKAELTAAAARLLERAKAAGLVPTGITADDVQRLLCGVGYAARLGVTGGAGCSAPGGAGADREPARRAELYLDLLLAGLHSRAQR